MCQEGNRTGFSVKRGVYTDMPTATAASPQTVFDLLAFNSLVINNDWSAAIQAAVNAAATVQGGVSIPPGTFPYGTTIVLPAGWSGQFGLKGWARRLSILEYTGTGDGFVFDLTGGAFPFYSTVQIEELSILANCAGTNGQGAPSGRPFSILYPTNQGTMPETHPG